MKTVKGYLQLEYNNKPWRGETSKEVMTKTKMLEVAKWDYKDRGIKSKFVIVYN